MTDNRYEIVPEIKDVINSIEQDALLFDEANYVLRADAIDQLEFHVIDRIDAILEKGLHTNDLNCLKTRAQTVKQRLEVLDNDLFERLRKEIRDGGCRGVALIDTIRRYVPFGPQGGAQYAVIGYDELDLFTNGLLSQQTVTSEMGEDGEEEMVYYQKTPARVIFELAEKAAFTSADMFYDLGSGLGQVTVWTNLLTGVTAKGVEKEPAYCTIARDCAKDLNLAHVVFINEDARVADIADGTVFFMYTPFEGAMLQQVLRRLKSVAAKRAITLFTYGPCSRVVADEEWLICVDGLCDDDNSLVRFSSQSSTNSP